MIIDDFDHLNGMKEFWNLPASMFSQEEVLLLRKHLRFYRSLDDGSRQQTTEAQKHFFEVTRGETVAMTVHEKVYMKYRVWCLRVDALKRERDIGRATERARETREAERRVAEDLARDAHREARLRKPKPKPSPAILAMGNQILAEQEKQIRE